MTTRTFDVELRPIEAIKPYPGNPRVNDDAVDAVAASLKEFGFRQPIVVDADGVIIVGHTPEAISALFMAYHSFACDVLCVLYYRLRL